MDRINGADWVDIGGGKRGYRSQNAAAGIPGTEVTDVWLNNVQEEILKVIEGAGLVANEADRTQLWQALQRLSPGRRADFVVNGWQSAPAVGAAEGDCYVVYPPATGVWAGKEHKVAVWRSGAWVFDTPVTGLMVQYWSGARPIFLVYTGALWVEDLATTAMPGRVQLATEQDVKDAAGLGVVQSQWMKHYTRSLLASSTFYLRPDGNDNNDGSANDAGHAFKTLAGAQAYIRNRYGVPGRPITFKLAPGTYAHAQINNIPAGLTIEGDLANQGLYILEGSGGIGVSGATVDFRGVTVSLIGVPTQHALTSGANGSVNLTNVTFGGVGQSTWSHILAAGGQVTVLGGASSVSFTSNARRAVHVTGGGGFYMATGSGLYFSVANYTYSDAVMLATTGGTIELGNGTIGGSAIGPRYRADLNGVISTAGGGANFIPGSSAGSVATGGQYV
ncbi:MAG TPA: DUF2793 domain-containing protein [Mesorhizobium sp.]|jgi:hypothetical protein|uniref:DUF2793 domain-containing protein n=1 Tax=Mesorhizobium sp. TaxID=1871066 RepID=UPI002DDD794C|nr:DUF2793 domain-containing protein [Mesorhizobium sp.]HEV2501594.1 DUF2793 domain-containing protein [Mesorhizobium sp.]